MNSKYKRTALITLIILIGAYLAVMAIVSDRLEAYETVVKSQFNEQVDSLNMIAETTARNGADPTTEAIIRDCTSEERREFETLLIQLDTGLGQAELEDLDRLFGRCGTYFAERKSIMVERLRREFAVYKSYALQLEQLQGGSLTKEARLMEWEQLVNMEVEQSLLFSELVGLQDKIIKTLLTGVMLNSPEIEAIRVEVRETQENLALLNTQASSVRNTILSL